MLGATTRLGMLLARQRQRRGSVLGPLTTTAFSSPPSPPPPRASSTFTNSINNNCNNNNKGKQENGSGGAVVVKNKTESRKHRYRSSPYFYHPEIFPGPKPHDKYLVHPNAQRRFLYPKQAVETSVADVWKYIANNSWPSNAPPPAMAVRSNGTCRHVMLRQAQFNALQCEGVAHYMQALSTNTHLSGTIVSWVEPDNEQVTMSEYAMHVSRARKRYTGLHGLKPDMWGNTRVWHTGYNMNEMMEWASVLHNTNNNNNNSMTKKQAVRNISNSLFQIQQLASSMQGSESEAKVPLIVFCNGKVEDGGYAWGLGSYFIVTPGASLQLLQGFRGLSLDPIGWSYFLPRVGWEYQQENSAPYSDTIAKILALTGYAANDQDLLATGLATHTMDMLSVADVMPDLELDLGVMPGHLFQNISPNILYSHGQEKLVDTNQGLRNKAVALRVYGVTSAAADGYEADYFNPDITNVYSRPRRFPPEYKLSGLVDPTTHVTELEQDSLPRPSRLVEMGQKFHAIVSTERTIQGFVARLQEVAALPVDEEEEHFRYLADEPFISMPKAAAEMLHFMQRQSPLALAVTFRLLQMGFDGGDDGSDSGIPNSLQRCMQREHHAQLHLYHREDYATWCAWQRQLQQDFQPSFANLQAGGGNGLVRRATDNMIWELDSANTTPERLPWKHDNINHVTADEVEEVIFGFPK